MNRCTFRHLHTSRWPRRCPSAIFHDVDNVSSSATAHGSVSDVRRYAIVGRVYTSPTRPVRCGQLLLEAAQHIIPSPASPVEASGVSRKGGEHARPDQRGDAQFIGLCSRSKQSKHRTKSPFLALLAMAGSNAAYKIISACSNAVRCRTLRRNGKKPREPGRLGLVGPRNTRREGLSREHRHAARFSCTSPRAYAFCVWLTKSCT